MRTSTGMALTGMIMFLTRHTVAHSMLLFFVLGIASELVAQTVRTATVDKDGVVSVNEAKAAASATEAKESKPEGKDKSKAGDSKGGDKDESGAKKKDGDDKKEDSGPVKRPTMSADDEPAGDITGDVALNGEGKVSFNLRNQPWEAVLQWLADSSQLSFDWLELPNDALNLTTTQSYTLPEARDIINRHLLARGYSMVVDGELMSVMKLSEVKPSLVPRVSAEKLHDLPDHTLCKTSFDLKWLIADEVIEEVAPLLSKAGKISKMSRTNRLEIMDTAGSLKDIHNILNEEQSDSGQEQLVKTFHLEHRRAPEVIVLLRELLGVDPPPGGAGGGRMSGDMGQLTNVMKQMTQQLQRMGNNSGGGGGGGREPVKTRLVLNARENMILVQAMPDQMTIVEKALQQIDVPVAAGDSLLNNLNKMKVYRLETVDPQTLVDLLQELGDMSPGTVLKVDKDKNSIVAFANLVDHLTITTLVERLDQSARAVEVIELRRLEAEYVAGTIRALMAPPEKEATNSRYSYYSRYSSQPEKKEEKNFMVEPDVENNRLLVYANKVEMDEINLLLQKLGEIPDPNRADDGMRIFELSPGEDPRKIIERIQQIWHRDNELKFSLPPKSHPDDEAEPKDQPAADDETLRSGVTSIHGKQQRPLVEVWPPAPVSVGAASESQRTAAADQFFASVARGDITAPSSEKQDARPAVNVAPDPAFVKRQKARLAFVEEPATDTQSATGKPPIKFSVTADGHLIVTSDDKAALMDMEDLLREVVPPAPKYKVYTLRYASPSYVTINLKEYFAAEDETESSLTYDYFWGIRPTTKKKSPKGTLGQKRPPTFIYDNFTSTILVRDADRRQLQLIEDLINVYDVPEPADTRSMRVTKIFKLQNARAEVVAQAVKDVFRDLLSANDKALEKKGEENKSQSRGYSYFGSSGGDDEDDTPIRFKGLLSIGVDPTSDTLVVSSTASLMDTVSALVLELDKAGEQSSSVQVVKVDSSVDLLLIQERLNKALGQSDENEEQKRKNKNGRETGQGVPVGSQPGQGK